MKEASTLTCKRCGGQEFYYGWSTAWRHMGLSPGGRPGLVCTKCEEPQNPYNPQSRTWKAAQERDQEGGQA